MTHAPKAELDDIVIRDIEDLIKVVQKVTAAWKRINLNKTSLPDFYLVMLELYYLSPSLIVFP